MSHKRSPEESVIAAAKLYHTGIVCPAVAWQMIDGTVAECDPASLFDSLAFDNQVLLRQIYRERPESLEALSKNEPKSHFSWLLAWCKKADT